MRDPARQRPIIEKVLALWQREPDLRLTQFLYLAAFQKGVSDIFYIEDEDLIEALTLYFEEEDEG